MKIAIVIYSNDPETVWNAFRLGNASLGYDDDVSIFLLGSGVECVEIDSLRYNVKEQMQIYEEFGGKMIGCGVCADGREDEMPLLKDNLKCPLGSMQDLYAIIKDADKVLTF
jgi:uncharacterized protein involved in oxidation of intracellular sulfur